MMIRVEREQRKRGRGSKRLSIDFKKKKKKQKIEIKLKRRKNSEMGKGISSSFYLLSLSDSLFTSFVLSQLAGFNTKETKERDPETTIYLFLEKRNN